MFKEVKSMIRIEDVIKRYGVQLNRANKGNCPFHSDKTPSFSVNTQKQIFKCFGCGKYGDAISFVADVFNITPKQAVIRISCDFGLNISTERTDITVTNRIMKEEIIKRVIRRQWDKKVVEYRKLNARFEQLTPKEPFEELSDEFIDVINKIPLLEEWLLNNL